MHQQIAASHANGYGEHNVFELLRRDRERVRDWDVDVDDFRCLPRNLLPAKRNDSCDTLRIGTRQLLCVFEIAKIETFPDLCH